MVGHRCRCTFVPPHVTSHLARRGPGDARGAARATAHQESIHRSQRARKELDIAQLAVGAGLEGLGVTPPSPGSASRAVWDSGTKWEQRVTLARGEGDPAVSDDEVNLVYDFAGTVRDYFQNELNRSSIDNQGMNLVLNVHYGVNYMNAFWDGDEMTFGDGDGAIFSSFSRSLDVVAHELAHGVTQFTANLDYYSQSGALNEHFSDVFGTAITQYSAGQSPEEADWLIGDEIMGPSLTGEALRSMKAPGTAYDNSLMGTDPQPAHMDDYYAGPRDNRGVHINSGIPNRVFYLVASDLGDTMKAARLWYHALQNLWPTAVFTDAAEVIVDSAQTLVGSGELPVGTPQTVRAAFRDVGIST